MHGDTDTFVFVCLSIVFYVCVCICVHEYVNKVDSNTERTQGTIPPPRWPTRSLNDILSDHQWRKKIRVTVLLLLLTCLLCVCLLVVWPANYPASLLHLSDRFGEPAPRLWRRSGYNLLLLLCRLRASGANRMCSLSLLSLFLLQFQPPT